jgi:hypothetical protein
MAENFALPVKNSVCLWISLLSIIKKLKTILIKSVVQNLPSQPISIQLFHWNCDLQKIHIQTCHDKIHQWAIFWASFLFHGPITITAHLHLNLQSAPFLWGLPTKILYPFVKNNMRAVSQCFYRGRCLWKRWTTHLILYVTEDEIFPTNGKCYVGFEILTAVTMKSMVFRVMLCSTEKVQYVMSFSSSGLKSQLSTYTASVMFSLLFDS